MATQDRQIEATELLNLLDSSEIAVTKQVKELVQENLNNSKEAWLVNSLVDFFVATTSDNCLQILINVQEPHDKHLLDKLHEVCKGPQRLHGLTLLSHLVKKQPPWLHKIVKHSVLSCVLKVLKSDNDVPVLMSGLLFITSLLPVVPLTIGHHLRDIFDVFGRLAMFGSKNSGSVPEVYMLHLRVGVYCLFHRLYGMYPCNFVTYLRLLYTREENRHLFDEHVKPLLEWVRVHPHLVTSTKETEMSAARWRHKEVHDIVVDCAKLSVDLIDGSREGSMCPIITHPHKTASPGFRVPPMRQVQDLKGPGLANATSDPTWSPTVVCRMSTPPPSTQLFTPGGSCLTPRGNQMSYSTTPHPAAPMSTPSQTPQPNNNTGKPTGGSSGLRPSLGLQMPSGASLASMDSMTHSPCVMLSEPSLHAAKKIDFTIAPPDAPEDDVEVEVQLVPLKRAPQATESANGTGRGARVMKTVSIDSSRATVKQEEKAPSVHTVASLPSIVGRVSDSVDMLRTVSQDALDEEVQQFTESLSSSSTDTEAVPDHIPDNVAMTAESVAQFMRSVNRIRFNTINITKDSQTQTLNGDRSPPHRRSNSCPAFQIPHAKLSNIGEDAQTRSEPQVCIKKRDSAAGPDLGMIDSATSPIHLCAECRATATQTSMVSVSAFFQACMEVEAQTPEQVYIPYAHMFPFVLSQTGMRPSHLGLVLPSSSTPQKPTSSQQPLFQSFSPAELLDRQISLGSDIHSKELSKVPLPGQKDVKWTHFGGKPPADEVTHLRNQVTLLHSQLLFERHKRELHARRNRRLLGKIVKTTALEEQSTAMHDQLRLQENEIQGLRVSMKLLQGEHTSQLSSKQTELVHMDTQLRLALEEKGKLEQENGNLKRQLEALKSENTKTAKELECAKADIFNLQKELEATREKANEAASFKQQITQLKYEILVAGELQQQYCHQMAALAHSQAAQPEAQLLLDSINFQLKETKQELAEKTSQYQTSKARLEELEELLKQKEAEILKLKRLLEETNTEHNNRLSALHRRQQTQQQIQKALEGELLVWQNKAAQAGRGLSIPQPGEAAAKGFSIPQTREAAVKGLHSPLHIVTAPHTAVTEVGPSGACPLSTPNPSDPVTGFSFASPSSRASNHGNSHHGTPDSCTTVPSTSTRGMELPLKLIRKPGGSTVEGRAPDGSAHGEADKIAVVSPVRGVVEGRASSLDVRDPNVSVDFAEEADKVVLAE